MEGADPHAARAVGKKRAQALAHLGGGLVGEGDGQDLPGADALVGDHVGDAHGEDARLSGTGAREHEERPARGLDGLALGGVEPLEVELGPVGRGTPHRRGVGHGGGRRDGNGALPRLGRQVGLVGRHVIYGDGIVAGVTRCVVGIGATVSHRVVGCVGEPVGRRVVARVGEPVTGSRTAGGIAPGGSIIAARGREAGAAVADGIEYGRLVRIHLGVFLSIAFATYEFIRVGGQQ